MELSFLQRLNQKILEVEVPDYFTHELKKNKKALTVFETFSNSNKKEYVQWVTEAKTETKRNSRVTTAIEWMSEGNSETGNT